MSARKRTRAASDEDQQQDAAAAEDVLLLKTAGDEAPLQADVHVIRAFSSCARGLPADAREWDLSGLLIDGQPVQHGTVERWLRCVRGCVHGLEDDSPAAQQLAATLADASSLYQLLALADAVGSTRVLLTACLGQLNDLVITAQLGEEHFRLRTDGRSFYFTEDDDGDTSQLLEVTPACTTDVGPPLSQQQRAAFIKQVAAQVEPLLHLAHRLRLQPLISRLHGFCAGSTAMVSGLFYGELALVFTERVLDSGGSMTMTKEAWLSSILTQPCSFEGRWHGLRHLLTPLSAGPPLTLKAMLMEDFAGSYRGDEVDVTLELFGSEERAPLIHIGGVELPVQLLLGRAVIDADDWTHLMTSRAAESDPS